MSGVEAILGVVSGGAGLASLALQLGETAVKLHRLYKTAKASERTLQRLDTDMKTMCLLLEELEIHRQRHAHSVLLMNRCISQCQRSVADICKASDAMERYMRRFPKLGGKWYAAIKRPEVREQLEDLERAKSALHLTYTIYLDGEHRRRQEAQDQQSGQQLGLLQAHGLSLDQMNAQLAIISQQLVAVKGSPDVQSQSQIGFHEPQCHDNPTKSDMVYRLKMKRMTHRQHVSKVRIQLPTWMCSQVWNLAFSRSKGHWWGVSLQVAIVRPYDSPIFECCRTGDVSGLLRLLGSGEASVSDIQHGSGRPSTPMRIACSSGQVDVALAMLPFIRDVGEITRGLFSYNASSSRGRSAFADGRCDNADRLYKGLLSHPDFDSSLRRTSWMPFDAWFFHCLPSCDANWIIKQRRWDSNVKDTPEERLERALEMRHLQPAEFVQCLGYDTLQPPTRLLKTSKGRTALHYVAQWIETRPQDKVTEQDFAHCIQIVKCAATCELDLHHQGDDGLTPLMAGIRDPCTHPRETNPAMAISTLRLWVDVVSSAGYSLDEYGFEEKKLWNASNMMKIRPKDPDKWDYFLWKIESLEYGLTPEEWTLLIRPLQHFTIHQLQIIPGALDTRKYEVLPRTIPWTPTVTEDLEGVWQPLEKKTLSSPSLVDLASYTCESISDVNRSSLVARSQDDHGVIPLMLHRAARGQGCRQRTPSQPPPIRRKDEYHRPLIGRRWMDDFHFCPQDSTWKLGCRAGQQDRFTVLRGGAFRYVCYVRSCMNGVTDAGPSYCAQSRDNWLGESFLADAAVCQAGVVDDWNKPLGHTAKADCKWGCWKLNLRTLKVPRELRCTHPLPADRKQ